MKRVEYRDLATMDYEACWQLQQALFDALLCDKRTPGDRAGHLLLVEHPPVYTCLLYTSPSPRDS